MNNFNLYNNTSNLNQQLPTYNSTPVFNNGINMNNISTNFIKNGNISQNYTGFKKKRHLEYDSEDSIANDYKKQRLIDDFNRLNISPNTKKLNIKKPSQTLNITITDITNTETLNDDKLLQEMKNDYFISQFMGNWQVAIFINWAIFVYFMYVNRFRSLYTKIKNILYWKLTKGIVQGLPIWEYYYNDCYESPKKYYYLGEPDVEMEM
ncbi:hypothetical protein HANVADRAFT_68865 [Hanseniaspora valbyensis NRRL Y-1626]|uniref:Uncharacterized protein n=1 Tax=Hanseniaspora valbyensis NRRL Y-1626 TaxID=766949 RepID=A0A1B7TES6_9ASCO|nr:hypothetical protein HANVADRAFT_68865 [Hanseniaspora valbyensis NRRL Y-1626]